MDSSSQEQHRHGCFNRKPRKKFVEAPYKMQRKVPSHRCAEGAVVHEVVHMTKRIPFTMSMDCKHDRRESDPSCAGCRWI